MKTYNCACSNCKAAEGMPKKSDTGPTIPYEMNEKNDFLDKTSALSIQEGGDHYKNMKLQPVEFISLNGIPFLEGCVIKRMCRWRTKGSPLEDLRKAKHEIDLLIEFYER